MGFNLASITHGPAVNPAAPDHLRPARQSARRPS